MLPVPKPAIIRQMTSFTNFRKQESLATLLGKATRSTVVILVSDFADIKT